jgi:hypothetical protein
VLFKHLLLTIPDFLYIQLGAALLLAFRNGLIVRGIARCLVIPVYRENTDAIAAVLARLRFLRFPTQ